MTAVAGAVAGPLAAGIATLVETVGCELRALEPLVGGRNNRVFRVVTDRDPLVAKAFYRDRDDPRDRLGAEVAFSRLAGRRAPGCAVRVVAADEGLGLALFEYVEGRRLEPFEVDAARVDEAAEFVIAVNEEASAALPPASEACFSMDEHVTTVQGRLDRFASIPERGDVDGRASRLVAERLRPAWERARRALDEADPTLARALRDDERCASPSDFGFHNAILPMPTDGPGSGRLVFHDFEYAGIDDPAKLVCDFRCQPELPVSDALGERFTQRIVAGLGLGDQDVRRIGLLLPVYRIKWCCILLGEFVADDRRRRRFASGREPSANDRLEQIAKVERMLDRAER